MKMRTDRTIRNCTVRIITPCPRRWEALRVTDDPGVRHCQVCARDVFFCSSTEETLEHARSGHCIARDEPHSSELPNIVVGQPTIVPVVTDTQRRAVEWARRENGINRVLDGSVEFASRPCSGCGYPVPNFRKSCYVCGLGIGRT